MNKFLFLMLLIMHTMNIYAKDSDDYRNESQTIVKEFASNLKYHLKSAIQKGGLKEGIYVCKKEAPKIEQELSEKYNSKVSRTSLKTRNPNNKPDQWEQLVLRNFELRKNNGEDINTMDYYEMTEVGFRYMKAISTKGLCLGCHGEKISNEIKTQLTELYPEDEATLFKEGDVRGAYSIIIKQ